MVLVSGSLMDLFVRSGFAFPFEGDEEDGLGLGAKQMNGQGIDLRALNEVVFVAWAQGQREYSKLKPQALRVLQST